MCCNLAGSSRGDQSFYEFVNKMASDFYPPDNISHNFLPHSPDLTFFEPLLSQCSLSFYVGGKGIDIDAPFMAEH